MYAPWPERTSIFGALSVFPARALRVCVISQPRAQVFSFSLSSANLFLPHCAFSLVERRVKWPFSPSTQ
jgi:hypothetical protein